jgi:ubiquinone/menaquinone biosynthesis C-methylase UbiE
MTRFDEQAKNWDDDPRKIVRAKILAKEILDYIHPNNLTDALEFGCGTGLLSFQLKNYFKTIMLVDNSKGMVNVLEEKIIKENIKNFKPIHINLLEDNLDISVDVIYTLMTFHHIVDTQNILKKFNSILNKNGLLCIADLVKEDGSFHSEYDDFDGHNGFDKDELTILLKQNGFEMVHYKIWFTIKKGNDSEKLTEYPLFLLIAKKV